MLTKLTITVPDLGDNKKNLEVEGALAVGEKATVTLVGIPTGTTTDGKQLRLRVLGPIGEDLAQHGDWTVGTDGEYTTDIDLASVQAYRLFVPPPPPPPPPRAIPVGYPPIRPAVAPGMKVRLLVELREDGSDGDEDMSMLGIAERPLVYWPTDWKTATLIDLADGRVYSKEEVDALIAQEAQARAQGDAANAAAAQNALEVANTKVAKAGDTMMGGLTTPNLTVGSRAEGSTVGSNSVAEGFKTTASGSSSHAEGSSTIASGLSAHAEGSVTKATGDYSHAEGRHTTAGRYSHAEGVYSEATGEVAHAEGRYTQAQNNYEHAQGQWNVSNKSNTTFGSAGNTLSSVGFGTGNNFRKNAVETMQDGKTFIYGLGGYDGTNPTGTGVKDIATAVNGLETEVGGKADLVDGKVPSSQLPSYVDDVVEYASLSAFPETGESGKIYVALDTNKTYRWSGSAYVMVGGDDPPVPIAPSTDPSAAGKPADAKATGDALAGKASTADATLTSEYGWVLVPATYQGFPLSVSWNSNESAWNLVGGSGVIGAIAADESATELKFRAMQDWGGNVDLYASYTHSYTLGSQSNKRLAPARGYALKSDLGTAASKDAPSSGDASETQVVMGNDTRLTDARTPTAHAATHRSDGSDPIDGSMLVVGGTGTYASAGIDTAIESIDTAIGNINTSLSGKVDSSDLATVAISGSYNDLTNKPTTLPLISPDTKTTAVATNDGTVDVTRAGGGAITDWAGLAEAVGLTPSDSLTADDIRIALGLPTTATLQDAITAAQNIPRTKTLAFQDAIAEPYTDAKSYAVGDLCTYRGLLYECTTAHPASDGSDSDSDSDSDDGWNAAHFTQTYAAVKGGGGGGGTANLLPYTSGTTLALDTSVYKSALNNDGTFPSIVDTAIETANAYYQFELELTVPSTVPSTITGPSGWTWIDGHGLPDPADLSGGETICISVRLDCTARTFLASVWRVA